MSADTLSSRAIIGMFYERLEVAFNNSWLPLIGMQFNSDQESETYNWLGQSPAMREWVGSRQAKGFIQNGFTVANKHFEATIEFLVRELRRDKTGQVRVRINELADRAVTHFASLVSTLILNGAGSTSGLCYDGQYFFDTDHADKGADYTTSQANTISVDISAEPAQVHGTTTAPSPEEIGRSILKGITTIQSFKDDRGEPMNEFASGFLVMVPSSLSIAAADSLSNPRQAGPAVSGLTGLDIRVAANPRINSWTAAFAVFRTDGNVKPFVLQEETGIQMKAKAEGSEFEFDNDAHQYGIDSWRNAAYGYWQHACLVTMT